MASFVHFFRYHCTDHIAKEYRISNIEYRVPATSWKWHSTRPHNYLLCLSSLRRSRDICLIIYLSYIFILYIYLVLFLFSAVRRAPSASASVSSFYRHPWLKSLRRKRDYASPISCCCDCPSFGSLIGRQIVHINEGKGKLALFSTKDNVLLTSHSSYSSAIDLVSLFDLSFYF